MGRESPKTMVDALTDMKERTKRKIGVLILGGIFLLLSGCAVQVELKNPVRVRRKIRVERGLASWYGPGFYGKRTANGEIYTGKDLTAAHRTLSFNTRVRVTRTDNRRSVIVRINDRGPWKEGYIIDLSKAAAKKIGLERSTEVKLYITTVSKKISRLHSNDNYGQEEHFSPAS